MAGRGEGRRWVWLVVLGVAGCARGGSALELDEDPIESDGGLADGSAGDGDLGDGDLGDGDLGDGDGDEDPADAGSGDGDADDPDGGGPVDPPPMPAECGFQNTCESPRALGDGDVSGDGAANGSSPLVLTQEATGNRSQWFSVHVGEYDNSFFTRVDVKFTVRLEITGNANYDLFVYYPDNQNDVSCTGPRQSSTNPGSLAELTSSQVSDVFGADDARNVRIEVRHVPNQSGDCGSWKLTIQGNQ